MNTKQTKFIINVSVGLAKICVNLIEHSLSRYYIIKVNILMPTSLLFCVIYNMISSELYVEE